ncbi:MAG: DNA polymerase/3'-5' exonuclease PolX [Anaerolineae bacterium]
MPMQNAEIAALFDELADLLEIEGANRFRVRAYRHAARTVAEHPRDMSELVAAGEDLTALPGIGKELAAKIQEMVETGRLSALEKVKQRTPGSLTRLLKIEGLGPKRVQTLYEVLGITNLEDLELAAKQGRIRELHGFGAKLEQKILDDLARARKEEARTRLDVAESLIEPLVAYLRALEGVMRVEVAGSYRRRKETVGDVDILAIGEDGAAIIQQFVKYEAVETVVSQGETRSTVLLRSGLQVDLRVVPQESYGAALLYFTGSKAHNVALRTLAVKQNYKINEYGVFRDDERVAGETETEVYRLLDLAYIEPELRENRGELQAAKAGRLPRLLTIDDIRGDLQMHTTGSDGKASLEEMVRAAQVLGYEYIAITDHSAYLGMVQGLDADALARQIDAIDALNDRLENFHVLKSIEVDILEDGSLDLPNEILQRLDLRICSIHSKFRLPREKQTERILRAMDNPYFNILAHPTGRRIGERPPYALDMERVMTAALERGCYLEINAHPERLDLNDIHAKMAQEMGLKLAISTDAHSVNGLRNMRFGVGQARRGWLEPDDVLNTRPWPELKALLAR